MGTSWYDVYFGGAVIGRAVYHNTSDTWFTGIVPEEAGAAGYSHSGLQRRCMHGDNGPVVGYALHWVALVGGARPEKVEHTMLACLRCQSLITPAWDEEGYGYLDYTSEVLSRVIGAEPMIGQPPPEGITVQEIQVTAPNPDRWITELKKRFAAEKGSR
jgi:hypothetical protein